MTATLDIHAGAAAFGDAQHPTTALLLTALEAIDTAEFQPAHILDMGCGSGILALRAAQKFPQARVIAADIARSAVEATRENAAHNQLDITVLHSDGFRDPTIAAHAPYDMLFMNILAEPLLQLAHAAITHLAEEGVLMLSGILAHQETAVRDAYEGLGLALAHRLSTPEWVALIYQRTVA